MKFKEACALDISVVRTDYYNMNLKSFCAKYECGQRIVVNTFGLKSGEKSMIKEREYIKKYKLRDLNTFLWDRSEDNDYWKREGFEIVEQGHIKMNPPI